MGWTTTYHYNDRRYSNKEIREYFKKQFESVNILYLSVKHFSEVYMACEKNGQVFAVICLIRNSKNDFGYKDMDETMLPYYFNAPEKLLKMLSPTDNKNALSWRKTCSLLNKVKPGTCFMDADYKWQVVKVLKEYALIRHGSSHQWNRKRTVAELAFPDEAKALKELDDERDMEFEAFMASVRMKQA